MILGDKAIFNYDGFRFGSARGGFWILDLVKRDWVFTSYGSDISFGTTNGGIFFNPDENNIYYGYYDGATNHLGDLRQNFRGESPSQSIIVFPVKLKKEEQISKIEIDWAKSNLAESIWDAQSIDITVSVGEAKKHFWGYGQTNSASDTENILEIDNTVDGHNKVAIGNEIVILENNTAGERAFIIDITRAGTNTCVLILDRALSAKTATGTYFNILPIKKAKGNVTYTKVEMATFYPKGNLSAEALVEIWVKQLSSNIFPIQIEEIRIFT